MRFHRSPVACALACALPLAAGAADSELRLAPVEVTAEVPAPAQTELFPFEARPARESAEALAELPGIAGSRKGGHGTDIKIRGLGEDRLNVILDGAYVFGGCPSRMDPPTSYAALSGYDRITVIRGMQTLEHGPGGPGGTVLLDRVTDPFGPDEGPRARLEAGYRGNGDGREIAVDLAAGNPQGYVRVLGGLDRTGNYEDGKGREVRSSYRQRSATLILGYTPDADHTLEFSIERQATRDILFPGLGMDSPYADDTALRLDYRSEAATGPFDDLRLTLYRTRVEHLMDNYTLRNSPSPDLAAPSESTTTGGRLVGSVATDYGRWKLGVDARVNRRDARRETAAGVLQSVLWPDARIRQLGLFGELVHPLAKDRRLVAGLRYDRVDARADQGLVNTDPAAAPTANDVPANLYAATYGVTDTDRSENNFGGLLRLEQDLADDRGIFYAGLSRSVRTADATERYIAAWMMTPTMVRVGNPAIRPEKHHQAELGLQWRDAGWRAEGSLYLDKVQDYILRDRNAARNEIYRNVDATLYGFDLSLRRQWSSAWSSTLGLSWVHAQNDTDDRPIAQPPPLEGNLSLDYRAGDWEAGGRLRAAATQTRVDTLSSSGVPGDGLDVRKTPGWMVLDLYARYRVGDDVDLALGVDNLFDHAYAEHLNLEDGDGNSVQVNEPGRSLWLKLSASF